MRRALDIAVHTLGAFAFLWPFFLGGSAHPEGMSHAAEAPLLFTLLGALLIVIAVADVRAGRMDAKQVAALGVLAAVNAMLRLPGSFGGASLMFVLPILCGATFGARFGFLLGAMSMAASGVITGGIGPWLPFQMWALGWAGAGGALAMKAGRAKWIVLASYGWFAGMTFGVLMNLWFWPFQRGDSPLAWSPGLGAAGTAIRYWHFYLFTSLAWDSARAIGNAVMLVVLGPSIGRVLARYRARLQVRWDAGSMSA